LEVFLPTAPGTYALHLHLATPSTAQIRKLGSFSFQPGEYVYVGSAFGPGGLQARLGRHLHPSGKRHWHIDDFLPLAQPVGFWFTALPVHLECRWVATLQLLPGAYFPARGLGASDCRRNCPAHLLAFPVLDLRLTGEKLDQAVSEIAPQQHTLNCQLVRKPLPAQSATQMR
jgi:Uri superfamily endonuclease